MNNNSLPGPQPVVNSTLPEPTSATTPVVEPVEPVAPAPTMTLESPLPKTRRLIVVISVLVVLGVGIGVFAYVNRGITTLAANGKTITIANDPVVVEKQFMNDIFVGNFKGAYGLTSTSFKLNQSLTAFTAAESSLQINQLTLSAVKISISSKKEAVSGTILAQGDHLFGFASRMIKQNGMWRVDNLVLN